MDARAYVRPKKHEMSTKCLRKGNLGTNSVMGHTGADSALLWNLKTLSATVAGSHGVEVSDKPKKLTSSVYEMGATKAQLVVN
jgi:hypothetical protein